MKKLQYVAYLLVFCLTVIYGCKKTSNSDSSPNKTIELGSCVPVTGGSLPIICFESVIAESRCPTGGQCIWEGYAAIKLSIKSDAGITQYFSLSTLPYANASIPPNDITISGYHIKLVNLLPYPGVNSPNHETSKVELQITR